MHSSSAPQLAKRLRVGPTAGVLLAALWLGLAAPAAALAASNSSAGKQTQKPFAAAKDAFARGDFERAAALCWQFLSTSDKNAEKYESAQFYLASSLEQLGLYHAAVAYYFQVANTRRNPELLPRTVRALEGIALEHPIDEDLVLRDLVADTDFGRMAEQEGDFIYYWQGVSNLHRGLHEWVNERFDRVGRVGYYYYLTLYTASVRLLAPATRAAYRAAVLSFGHLFGALDLSSALESLRRRGESDAPAGPRTEGTAE